MKYQALYRKFRPQDFDKVYGQEHVVTTLRNELISNRIGHGYVFSGTRGTGKTSIAKIFAKAVNCENLENGNPCNKCSSCKKINDGSSLNVQEIDGASNNGVDHIRSIIEDISYPPVEGKRKVYIIDEAHMVTNQAFNALLKTIEEPPEYAIFILATTEVKKIPITILSRCQRYDFRRITVDTIALRINELKQAENINIDDRGIKYIARLADGSMRDALSMFDQCISYYYGRDISYDMTLEMFGYINTDMYSKLFRAINSREVKTAIDIVEVSIIRGMEPESFVSEFIYYLRNLLLVKNGESIENIADISTEDAKTFNEDVNITEEAFIIRGITVFSRLLSELKYSRIKRIGLEIGIIRLCQPQMDNDYTALLDRIKILENKAVNYTDNPKPPELDEVKADRTGEEKGQKAEEVPWEEYAEAPVEECVEEPISERAAEYDEQQIAEHSVKSISENENPDYVGDNIEVIWRDFLETLAGPTRANTSMGIPQSIGENKVKLYFDKNDRGCAYYSADGKSTARIEELKNKIKEFLGQSIELSLEFVDSDKMPTATEKEISISQAVLKRAALNGIDIIEE